MKIAHDRLQFIFLHLAVRNAEGDARKQSLRYAAML